MLDIESWMVFYADGSTFSSEDGSWAEAPAFGVACVVYYHPNDRITVQTEAHDISVYEWWPVDVPRPTGVGQVSDGETKMGVWISDEKFYTLINRATRQVTP